MEVPSGPKVSDLFPTCPRFSKVQCHLCYRKCPSGECELWQPERVGGGWPRSCLLQGGNSTTEPKHDAAGLDPHRATCPGNSHWIKFDGLQLCNTCPPVHLSNCDISLQPIGVQLVSIQTSPNDRLLWALDNRGSVFVRTGLSDEMPVGTDWELVPGNHLSVCLFNLSLSHLSVAHLSVSLVCLSGLAVSQLVLSCRTVWVRCVNGDLARRYGVCERNPAGDYWKKIPGSANWLTGETLDLDYFGLYWRDWFLWCHEQYGDSGQTSQVSLHLSFQ